MSDDEIIQKAYEEDWILVTNDKDFGEQVYLRRKRRPVCSFTEEDAQKLIDAKDDPGCS